MEVGTISSASDRDIRGGQISKLKTKKVFLFTTQKTIICEAQAKKAEKFPKKNGECNKAVQAKKSIR